ncbi:MAG: methyltransferase [Oscillospiraceae bacterium]|nr:methyltransferase [Oscillospiraceae bacterium]
MAGKFMQQAANRDYSKWWQAEGSWPWMFQQSKAPIEGRPYSILENYKRVMKGEQPYWMPAYMNEINIIWPDAMEEHPVPEVNGPDWWGVDWFMETGIGGMMVTPGTRTLTEFANWKEELEWPDLSVVDFETDGKKISSRLDPERAHVYECVEGLFERLHELIPFDESLLAFYEEPELLEEFFQKMVDYKIESCSQIFKHYGRVDGVLYHDDWGAEKAGFFSNDMFEEQIMPATKRFFDFLHKEGKFIELHSCGRNMQYVPFMIEMGIDFWAPQQRCNDMDYLYDTYGDKISLAIALNIPVGTSEEDTKKMVHDFVDRYGEKGRTVCWITTDDANLKALAADELFKYSFEYYNKLYGRN